MWSWDLRNPVAFQVNVFFSVLKILYKNFIGNIIVLSSFFWSHRTPPQTSQAWPMTTRHVAMPHYPVHPPKPPSLPDLYASYSHSLASPMTLAPTPCLLLPLLPNLVHSNRLPSYLLFTQALQPANFPLCSKPTSGQRLFGVALDCLLFPATAQWGKGIKKWTTLPVNLACLFIWQIFQGFWENVHLSHCVYSVAWLCLACELTFIGFLSIRVQCQSLLIPVHRADREAYPFHIQYNSPLWVIRGQNRKHGSRFEAQIWRCSDDFFFFFFISLLFSLPHQEVAMREWLTSALFPFRECSLFGHTIVLLFYCSPLIVPV